MVILLIALIVVGPKKLPDIGRSIGKGLQEFRRTSSEIRGELSAAVRADGGGGDATTKAGDESPSPSSDGPTAGNDGGQGTSRRSEEPSGNAASD
jgi:TatA/E family protein of Tat protein translocase